MTPGVAAATTFRISDDHANAWLSVWLWTVACLVVIMVAVGGATRLTDSRIVDHGMEAAAWRNPTIERG